MTAVAILGAAIVVLVAMEAVWEAIVLIGILTVLLRYL